MNNISKKISEFLENISITDNLDKELKVGDYVIFDPDHYVMHFQYRGDPNTEFLPMRFSDKFGLAGYDQNPNSIGRILEINPDGTITVETKKAKSTESVPKKFDPKKVYLY